MLTPESFPVNIAKDYEYLYLEIPKSGGHTGFISFNKERECWSESRALELVCKIREG